MLDIELNLERAALFVSSVRDSWIIVLNDLADLTKH